MRNSLLELPVLAAAVWAGLASGMAAFLLRLPGKLYERRLKGRRAKLFALIPIRAADVLAGFAAAASLALALYYANGGEPRLYAVLGFAAAFTLAYLTLGLPLK